MPRLICAATGHGLAESENMEGVMKLSDLWGNRRKQAGEQAEQAARQRGADDTAARKEGKKAEQAARKKIAGINGLN
jgi:hypothetical protein